MPDFCLFFSSICTTAHTYTACSSSALADISSAACTSSYKIAHITPPFVIKQNRQKEFDGRGVGNHLVIDSAAFGLPLLYNRQPPDP